MRKEDVIRNLYRVKLVIGNGFDLFCGLKTSYSDFFKHNKSLLENIEKWIESYDDSDKIYDYLDYSNPDYEKNASEIILEEEITIWDIFFYLVSQFNIDNEILWCDIEAQMARSLDISSEYNFFSWEKVLAACNRNNFMNIDKQELLCACYVKSRIGNIIGAQKFYQFLYDELERFEKRFGEYINQQMSNPIYTENAHATINKLVGDNRNTALSIDTFNYSTFKINGIHLNHINGTYLKPIFGIDYSNINVIDDRYAFTKIYRRLEQNFSMDKDNIDYTSNRFDNIIVFGHSLNRQDYNYFFPLFDSLKITDPSFKGKLVFAYSIYDKEKSQQIKSNLLLNVAKLLREYEIYSKGKDENRLLEILNFKGCIIYYPIFNSGLMLIK